MKKAFTRVALAAFSTTLSLAVLEVALRISDPPPSQDAYSVPPTRNQYDFYQFDGSLGWSNTPLAHGTLKRADFEHSVYINKHGLRQKEVELQPAEGVFRIAFLGDSFVWGIGLPDEQRFPDIVGHIEGVEALNFGVSGYGPVQHSLLVNKVVSFEPDLVIVAICLGNDFDDNVLYRKYGYFGPYYALDARNELKLKGYPVKNVKKFLLNDSARSATFRSSVLVDWISSVVEDSLASTDEEEGLANYAGVYDREKMAPKERRAAEIAILINEKILEKMKRDFEAAGIPMVLLSAPTKREYVEWEGRATRNEQVAEILRHTATKLGVELIDTVSQLDGRDFWANDGHWNPRGHQKVAEAVRAYLAREKRIAAGALPLD